ncbi:iron-sulfur cluster assembly accessory protein Isa2 [Mycena sanguinolenta]|nr:iron-sulfur cluster assembly accessory protein Isa2 [Mycena sanguinolenta]
MFLSRIRFRGPLAPRTRAITSSWPLRAASSPVPPAQRTVLLSSPSPEYLEQEEIEVDILPTQETQIVLTDRAAEQLRTISARQTDPDAALRIAVESGGCHGYQYKMELAKSRALDDYHFSHPTVKPSNILVDAVSLSLLNGSTIDFATELIGSSFRVLDNPHAKGSGCGCGVSWELKT